MLLIITNRVSSFQGLASLQYLLIIITNRVSSFQGLASLQYVNNNNYQGVFISGVSKPTVSVTNNN